MGSARLNIWICYEPRRRFTYVDAEEKIPRGSHWSLKWHPRNLDVLRSAVYDAEREGARCRVDVAGWIYNTEKVQRMEKGFFPPARFSDQAL